MAHLVKVATKSKGTRWRVRWAAANGRLLSKTFRTRREARDKQIEIEGGRDGLSTLTVEHLCIQFLTHFDMLVDKGVRERSSYEQYRQHICHVKKDVLFGARLDTLKTPDLQLFLDRLLHAGMTPATARKIRTSLGRMVRFGMQRGMIMHDPVRATQVEVNSAPDEDDGGAVTFPTQDELSRLLDAADARHNQDGGFSAALVRVLLFCGLRISEARGLTRDKLILSETAPYLLVHRKMDRFQKLGRPKNASSRRKVPLGTETAQALRAWLSVVPVGPQGLVFPNGHGNPESAANLWNRVWAPLCGAAGVADRVNRVRKDRNSGRPRYVSLWSPRFGFHAMRHAYASINIANGVQPKKLAGLMGHTAIKTTMDLYGHLWVDDAEDSALASAAERMLKHKRL